MAKAKGDRPAEKVKGESPAEKAKAETPTPAEPRAEVGAEQAKAEPPAPTPPDDTPAVLERVTALERQNRRLRTTVIVLAVVVVVATAVGTTALVAPYNAGLGYWLGQAFGRPEVVEAQRTIVEAEQFILRGPDRKVRATLALRDRSAMGLDFYDDAGRARMGLDLGADGQGNLWLAADDGQIAFSLNPRGLRVADPAGGAAVLGGVGLSVVDRNQKGRIGLAIKDDDAANLTLYDRDGRFGALVDVSPDGSRLGLFHGGVVRAGIGYGRGGAQLNLFGQDGTDHATLGLMPDGSTGLLFHDREGKQRIALGVLANDTSGLSVFDRSEKHRAGLSIMADGSPHLELYDASGARRAGLALTADGLPGLQLEDRGQPRAVLGAADGKRVGMAPKAASPSSLLLFDKDGSLVFQAPVY